ncbi:histidine phosphatase family protein [Planomicrobium sp. Y74]|uniref:histidine phosphatase family protein n=1 Tax=Planomicrobium sp. Y74 TaxID=2478977 RepID=UPI000EF52126|nr:histidine phosphatase family protein [Planomicrobium sp. Y74]RLQ90029.1 histidine phosphatase family protein [Planomicrobium sp. Y74]
MLTLYITRHGETEWNLEKRMQGWGDSPLTEKGKKNALELGGRLKDTEFEAVYASPSLRAFSTAQAICAERKLEIKVDDKLREINVGEWEGKEHVYINENYPEEYFSFWNTPHLYTSATGENFSELQERALEAVHAIREHHREGNILIVTHSIIIKALLVFFKKLPLEDLWSPPFIHDTSLTIVEAGDENFTIVLEGDTSHVKKLQTQERN